MKRKRKKSLNREELADLLERLARQLREGTVAMEGRSWPVSDQLAVKIGFSEKKGRFTAKLKWQWSTLDGYPEEDRREIAQWKESFKTVKKQLNASFKNLLRQAREGDGLPDPGTLAQFVAQSYAFARHAEPEWRDAMDEYLDHLGNLERAVREGRPETVAHELRDIKSRVAACHREFK